MDRFFLSIHGAFRANRWMSLWLLVMILSGLGYLASRISFEEDITKLIPANEDNKKLQRVLNSVNFTDKIIVNIQKQEGSTEALVETASMIMDSLNSLKGTYIKDIQGQIDEDRLGATLDFVYQHLPLFLNSADYDRIAQKIHPDSIDAITRSNYNTLISPSGIIAKKTILKDPLGLSFIGLEKLQDLGMGDDFVLKEGFILSKDEQNILLFINPIYPTNNTDQNTPFAERLYEMQESIQKEFDQEISVEFYGGALVAVANAAQIKRDIQFTVGIAITVLLVIFMFFYRSF
ncbi:MAG: glycerol acyltransferase, partial [Flavobacteriaceae bacterium]|nr:glycerol acyltransferase [Flavobacteriaceae bacterium]